MKKVNVVEKKLPQVFGYDTRKTSKGIKVGCMSFTTKDIETVARVMSNKDVRRYETIRNRIRRESSKNLNDLRLSTVTALLKALKSK